MTHPDAVTIREVPLGDGPTRRTVYHPRSDGRFDREAQLWREASGSESFEVDLVAEGVLAASELAPVAGALETDVFVEVRFEVLNATGDVLASDTASDTPVLTVERDGYEPGQYGDVGGSGSLTIETN